MKIILVQFVFFRLVFFVLFGMFFYFWGDYIKILIFIEVIRLIFIRVLLLGVKFEVFRLRYFFICLIFLVCESSLGFLLFVFYIRIESEVVKKLVLVQF